MKNTEPVNKTLSQTDNKLGDDYAQLRALLDPSNEAERLKRLERRVGDVHQRSRDIAEALPMAMRTATFDNQAELTASLQASVDQCVTHSVKQDPKTFAKAIMPVLAPPLKKTIADAFKSIREFSEDLQTRLRELENNVDNLKQGQINELLRRLGYIEQTVAYLNNLEGRLDRLEDEKFAQLFEQLNALEDEQIQPLVQHVEGNKQELITYLNNLEGLLNHLKEEQVQPLTQHVEDNKQYLAHLLEKTQQLEKVEETATKALSKRIKHLEQGITRFKDLESIMLDAERRTEELARLLPQAIRQSIELYHTKTELQTLYEEGELTESLRVPVERCIRKSIEHDAHSFANALFPIMGPAIRRSINETFKSIIQSINTTVEQSLSPQGLAWRIEAIKTGRPFSDIVLQKTFVYRVEQVFLIHKETGLLLQHVSRDGTEVGDSDAISAMLTAIQDFIRDSFSTNKNEELASAEVGDYTVWLDRSPHAVLACVVRGVAPYSFREKMRTILEVIQARHSRSLENFSGDTAIFDTARPVLEKALEAEKVEDNKPKKLLSPLLIVSSILFTLAVISGYSYYQHQKNIHQYIEKLQQTPGIVLISYEHDYGQLTIHGLRDPLAADPTTLAQAFSLQNHLVTDWTPYSSLVPQFVVQRLKQALKPPDSVNFEIDKDKVKIRGHADTNWIDKFQQYKYMVAGLSETIQDELVDRHAFWTQTEEEFDTYLKKLKNTLGIVIISSGIEEDKRVITGLRDPLADDPEQLAKEMQLSQAVLDNLVMQWRSYQDLTPEFVEKRAYYRLQPPKTAKLHVNGRTLYLEGHAPQAWIDKIATTSRLIAGVEAVDTSALEETDHYLLHYAQQRLAPSKTVQLSVKNAILRMNGYSNKEEIARLTTQVQDLVGFADIETQHLVDIDALIDYIEKITVQFGEDAELRGKNDFAILYQNVKKLLSLRQDVQIQITGYTDGVGARVYNENLSHQRAAVIYNRLVAQGMSSEYFIIVPPPIIRFGEQVPNFDERKVTFKILMRTRQRQEQAK